MCVTDGYMSSFCNQRWKYMILVRTKDVLMFFPYSRHNATRSLWIICIYLPTLSVVKSKWDHLSSLVLTITVSAAELTFNRYILLKAEKKNSHVFFTLWENGSHVWYLEEKDKIFQLGNWNSRTVNRGRKREILGEGANMLQNKVLPRKKNWRKGFKNKHSMR